MDKNYPDVGYGNKYDEFTLDRLKNEYREVADEIQHIREELANEGEYFRGIVGKIQSEISYDGILVRAGTKKVDENSEIALTRKAKARCMRFLGVGKYRKEYTFNGYKEEVFEDFLVDDRLPLFLNEMQNYMNENYPEIGYGSQREEITVERLKTNYEGVYKELEDIRNIVEGNGDEWEYIRQAILAQAGIKDEYSY